MPKPSGPARVPRSRAGLVPTLLLLSLAAVALGCEGTVGPCSGGDCPAVPGCEGDLSVTCGPESICLERVCEGVGWICGQDQSGAYVWLRKSAPCDDGNSCTSGDICVAGTCVGTPVECNNPPQNTCVDSLTLKTFSGSGTCSAGLCSYASQQVTCPGKCQAGKCEGSPCTGITCTSPPGKCYSSTGTCTDGKCSYAPLASGTSCDLGDKCISGSTCDGQGTCSGGTKLDCTKSNTTGGTCVAGTCQGYSCTSGYGNCNSSWSDGCETTLNTTSNCGSCGKVCGQVAHGTSACSGGACIIGTCESPWKDCDSNVSTGCEIPSGVANACSFSGVTYTSGNPSGCGTAYCGSSSSSKAKNFGTWTCVACSHCHKFSNGYAWCLSGTALFSTDRCSTCCNDSLADKVCTK